ncbi:MAG: VRR-NUC domain-containing protein [Pedobacter sp.]|nr:VRR-NUC domain-containing protein [Pedobacter sp.]
MPTVLPDPFYYLENFRQVLDWVGTRHADLLDARETGFITGFHALPRPAQALLVRMVMRKGDLFRASKLDYAEIGATAPLLALLAERDLIDAAPELTLEELFAMLRKDELQAIFGGRGQRKDELLESLQPQFPEAHRLQEWQADFEDNICRLLNTDIFDRLRLMFFGNLHQDWSEFVLTDLGLLHYEPVEISASSRAFQQREEVDAWLYLHGCRTRFEEGENLQAVLADIPASPYANTWLEERRARLLFSLGQQLEREKNWSSALSVYAQSRHPDAQLRSVRVLEQNGDIEAAHVAASILQAQSSREEDQQQLARSLPRLRRKLGLPRQSETTLISPERRDITLEPMADLSVEFRLREHLHSEDAPVFYVENALINSLFGLLCWPAIFAPLPGAFFHAFHYGPVDLHHPDFRARRETEFRCCLAQLESDAYKTSILEHWHSKQGRQSPFVFWDVLDENLLQLALDCIPPAHLRALFERLLGDIRSNRSGFPDLIQFWPQEKRYLMLEVKGPGDRLQDNQSRWLDYCARHGIPVAVSHVSWAHV